MLFQEPQIVRTRKFGVLTLTICAFQHQLHIFETSKVTLLHIMLWKLQKDFTVYDRSTWWHQRAEIINICCWIPCWNFLMLLCLSEEPDWLKNSKSVMILLSLSPSSSKVKVVNACKHISCFQLLLVLPLFFQFLSLCIGTRDSFYIGW